MEVKKNTPPPQPVPPPTYDITGLTEDQVTALRDILGQFAFSPVERLYDLLDTALGLSVASYDVEMNYTAWDRGQKQQPVKTLYLVKRKPPTS